MLWDEVSETAWKDVLAPVKPVLDQIDEKLQVEIGEGWVHFPVSGCRFSALAHTEAPSIKCVVVGQDPYPGMFNGKPFATGMAFSVPQDAPLPASLKNIDKELRSSGCGTLAGNGDLTFWAEQGVLLINAVMTLKAGESNSHLAIGWQNVTGAILRHIVSFNPNACFLGFGRFAHQLYDRAGVPVERQIKTSHPSPLGATKAAKDGSFDAFMGSNCFNRVNDYLVQRGATPIVWGRK